MLDQLTALRHADVVHHEQVDVNLVSACPPHILVCWEIVIKVTQAPISIKLTSSAMLDELDAASVTLHGVRHVTDVRGEVEGVKTPVRLYKILLLLRCSHLGSWLESQSKQVISFPAEMYLVLQRFV